MKKKTFQMLIPQVVQNKREAKIRKQFNASLSTPAKYNPLKGLEKGSGWHP